MVVGIAVARDQTGYPGLNSGNDKGRRVSWEGTPDLNHANLGMVQNRPFRVTGRAENPYTKKPGALNAFLCDLCVLCGRKKDRKNGNAP